MRVPALVALGLCVLWVSSCKSSDKPDGSSTGVGADGDGGVGDAGPAPFFPTVEAADPCEVAGYVFDGKSDCNEVRCPELTCECEPLVEVESDEMLPPPEVLVLSACVPTRGCVAVADCNRLCDPSTALARNACDARIGAAGSLACETDEDCVAGECRKESVGEICIDLLACSEDGNCGAGSACLFDPEQLDPVTSFPTTVGACADGSADSACFDDEDCVFGTCLDGHCTGGVEGESCSFNGNCASGFCRITDPMQATGSCVSGERGSGCTDAGDCKVSLHCTAGGVCVSDAVGQACDDDAHCQSGICVAYICRGGELGSLCEDDADCTDAFCVGNRCASGGLLAPCYEAADCQSALACVRQRCSDGSVGMPCSVKTDCAVLACADGACSEGANGADCDEAADCKSQRCADPAGVESGVCTSGKAGALCVYPMNCESNLCTLGVCD